MRKSNLKDIEQLPASGKKFVFVGHDFSLTGGRKKRFRQTISECLKNTKYSLLYSDPEVKFVDFTIIKDIRKKIEKANCCIFDLTGFKEKELSKNLNVILEIGISIGLIREAFIAHKEGCIDISKELSDLLGKPVYTYKKTFRELISKVRNFIESVEYINS